MRICFCLNGPNQLSGPNVWMRRHLPLLREFGAEPQILYFARDVDERCQNRDWFEGAGFPVRSVHAARYSEVSIEAIVRMLQSSLPDVFVPNYTVPAYYAARFLRESGIVTVGTMHSDDAMYRDLEELFITGPEKWRLSAVAVVSRFLRERLAGNRSVGIPVLHAPYGVPIPARLAQHRLKPFRILYVGRLDEWQKRITRVVRRLIAACEAFPEVEAVLHGDGRQREAVEAMIATSGLGGRIRHGGVLRPEDVVPALLDAQAIVLLSDFEGLPISLMEAMASGVVSIVSSMRSGIPELIVDGENGLMVESDDEAGFIASVGRLVNSPSLWERLSTAARATIIARGDTPQRCAQRWLEFCRSLVSEVRRGGAIESPRCPEPAALDLPPRPLRRDGIWIKDRRALRNRIRELVAEVRPVFLWGAGSGRKRYFSKFHVADLKVLGFVDSDPTKQGTIVDGLEVYPPEVLAVGHGSAVRPYVIISLADQTAVIAQLEALGYRDNDDYFAISYPKPLQVAGDSLAPPPRA